MVLIVADYPERAPLAFSCCNCFSPSLKSQRHPFGRSKQQPEYAQVAEGCGQHFDNRVALPKAYWPMRSADKTAHSIPAWIPCSLPSELVRNLMPQRQTPTNILTYSNDTYYFEKEFHFPNERRHDFHESLSPSRSPGSTKPPGKSSSKNTAARQTTLMV